MTVMEVEQAAESVDPALLLLAAVAYQGAQSRLQIASEGAARDLLLRLRPVTNADMADWMDAWDRLLAAQQRQQGLLTLAYVRSSLQMFGVSLPSTVSVPATDPLWGDLVRYRGSRAYGSASPELRQKVDDAVERVQDDVPTLDDAHLADRVNNLHAPVVKVRVGLSEGKALDEVLDEVADHVEAVTFNASRGAERTVAGHVNWPTFQNGTAMLYRRVLQPGACGWCVLVSTRLYALDSFKRSRSISRAAQGEAHSAAWHRGCRCTWQLVTLDQAQTYASGLGKSGSDYFSAARAAGLWEGPAPANYAKYIAEKRFDPVAAAAGATGATERTDG